MRALILLCAAASATASPPADPPRFEVASVKATANIQTGYGREQIIARPGSLIMHNMRLRACIKWAYDVKEYQIAAPSWMGSPGWMGSELARFEISAKATPDTPVAELKRMLQTLLAERFGMELHRQSKEMPTYAMNVVKSGSSLHPAEDQEAESTAVQPGNGPVMRMRSTTMAQFAEFLAGPLHTPVIDNTGLKGRFDLAVDMSAYKATAQDEEQYLFLKAMQDQLGLKLEKQKSQIEMLIIDHAEKMPTGN
jgi:uncharacterized protein (TIGR03435 family)